MSEHFQCPIMRKLQTPAGKWVSGQNGWVPREIGGRGTGNSEVYAQVAAKRAMSDYFEEHLITGDVAMNFSTSFLAPRRPESGYITLGRELVVLYRPSV